MTSYPSEWFGAFNREPTYVVLHLRDGRRLYGWPEEWPNSPDIGHFSIMEADWLVVGTDASVDRAGQRERPQESRPLEGVERILVPAEDIRFVEFMSRASNEACTEETTHG